MKGSGSTVFRNGSGDTERVRINASGNVGINETNPLAMLHFSKQTTWGTSENRIININNTGTGGDINFPHNMGSITWYSGNSVPTAEIAAYRNTPASGNNIELRFTTADAGTQYERMRITSGGNVGIGTTNPYSPLQVGNFTGTGGFAYGTVATFAGTWSALRPTLMLLSTDTVATQDKGAGIGFGINSEAGSTPYTYAQIKGLKEVAGGGYSGYMAFYTTPSGSDANTERMRINSIGNVGIGTTSPNNKLSVNGNIETTGSGKIGFNVNDAYGSFPHYGLGYPGGANVTNLAGYFGLTFGTGGAERMCILGNGNVGIGTTSPGSKLHVYSGSSGGTPYTEGITAESNSRVALNLLSGAANDSYVFFGNSSAGNAGYIGYENTANRLVLRSSDYVSLLDSTGEVIRIDGGNVGIGTTSPAQLLHLYKPSGSVFLALQSSTNYGYFYNDGTNIGLASNIGSTGFKLIVNRSAPDNSLVIASTGNVGIGTSSPGYSLEVQGGVWARDYFIQNSSGTGGTFRLDGYQDYLYFYGDSSAIAGYRFGTDSLGTVMQIGTNGNVGIGTANPDARLSVKSIETGAKAITILGRSDDIGTIRFLNSAGTSEQGGLISTATSFALMYNDVTRLYITAATGNVGIGTTSPAYKLDITGGDLRVSSGANTRLLLLNTSTNGLNYSIYSADTGNLIFGRTGIADYMTIANGGNVGIGTTSPTNKLQVNHTSAPSFNANGGTNAFNLARVGGSGNPGTFGAGITFSQPYLTDDAFIGVGGIYGVKSGGNGAFGGGLAFFAQPNSAADMFEVFRYNSSGNVGIGTTSPGYALDVIARASGEGGVRFWNNRAASSTVDSVAIHLNVSNTVGMTGGKIVVAENTNDAWPTNMQFYINSAGSSYSPVEAMRITSLALKEPRWPSQVRVVIPLNVAPAPSSARTM
jgi:hypothetical protein